MLKEFALEPEAVATWASFKDFIDKFGVSKGRVIAAFPRKWARAVKAAARIRARDKEYLRIVENLNRIEKLVLLDRGRPSGDGTLPWLDRALLEHGRTPFDGIIVQARPAPHPVVLTIDEVDDDPPLFHAVGQMHIRRTAEEIVGCVALLASCANTIKLVDPHFKANEPRWKRPLLRLLKLLRDQGRTGVSIEVHRDDDALHANIRSYFDSTIPGILPPGVALSVFLHPRRDMHNRFILTDRGGASYQTGLDDNEEGKSSNDDMAVLLEHHTYKHEWDVYSCQPAFLTYPSCQPGPSLMQPPRTTP